MVGKGKGEGEVKIINIGMGKVVQLVWWEGEVEIVNMGIGEGGRQNRWLGLSGGREVKMGG